MTRRILAALLLLALFLGGWAFYWEPSSLSVHRYELRLPHWPREQNPLLIAVLSDLHVGSPYYGTEKLREVVRRVNASRVDLVLLAGDYLVGGIPFGTFVPPEDVASILKELDASLGVYAVLGNHDWWFDGPRLRRAFESEGIRFLEDESLHLALGHFDFWLVGLSDWREKKPDVDAVLAAVPEAAPILVFTHNPDVFPVIPERVSLTLAGHTHGGQVRFPFLGAPIVPSEYGERYAQGHIVEEGKHLFVTSGLGTSIIPVRFRVPPEIALVEIRTPLDRSSLPK